jgi:hypothetical protein
MIPSDERDNILKSMEEHNIELTKKFERYREIKNTQWPKIEEDETISPKDQTILVQLYYDHRAALHDILECAGNLKKDIENIELFFKTSNEHKIILEKHIFKESGKTKK